MRAKYAVAREFTAKLFAGRLEAAGKCIGAADGTSSEPAVAKIAEERYFI